MITVSHIDWLIQTDEEGTMKKIVTLAVMGLSLLSNTGQAEDKPGMKQGMPGMGGMQGMMHMSPEQMDKHMRSMQSHMLMMHDYSNRILSEKDPKKKQSLKDEQLELMKAHHMQMMKHRQQMRQMHRQQMQ